MYCAKADGRRTYRFFEPDMDAHVKERRTLELDLRQAIAAGEFELYYQPVVNLESDRFRAAKRCLRWHHPRRGLISPADFIPVAEDSGLIGQIGEWVIATAVRRSRELAGSYPDRSQHLSGPVQKPDTGAEGRCRAGVIRTCPHQAGA